MSKLTEWYPPEIKPAHVGWYDCEECQSCKESRHYWDGMVWLSATQFIFTSSFKWRGLTRKPK